MTKTKLDSILLSGSHISMVGLIFVFLRFIVFRSFLGGLEVMMTMRMMRIAMRRRSNWLSPQKLGFFGIFGEYTESSFELFLRKKH